jgi:NitT/TauT family transport system substrate-binding protein
MRRKMKKGPKVILSILAAVVVGFGLYYAANSTNLLDSLAPKGGSEVIVGNAVDPNYQPRPVANPSREPLTVCVVTWGGYAGGEYFNGSFDASEESRYYRNYGILVEFRVMDDFLASREAWKNGQCDLLWATVDAFTTEAANLQNAGFNPVFLFQADWSRGGDAIVVRSGISSMSDLRGRRVAVAYGTPSHTFALRMLESAGMTVRDIQLVDSGSAIEAANMFKAGQVEAAAVWSPDDDACLKAVPGSKILVNTKEATHIIADGFFAKAEFVNSNQDELRALVEGWLIGAAEINESDEAREQAARILANGLNIPLDEASNAIGRVRLTTYGDNRVFFGLDPVSGAMTGEKLFRESGQLYRQNGYTELVPSVPSWRTVTDLSILRDIDLSGPMHQAEGSQRFTAPTEEAVVAQEFTAKELSVTFPTNSAVLDDNAKQIIDIAFVPTAQSFAGARVRIEGNTDSTGSREVNMRLSRERAEAVAAYLANQYGFDRNRFVIVGNGPDEPVCYEDTPACYARNRRTDFELIAQ